ncbi:M56 family metallopeptidase [Parablautia muri]|uniref:M56 family metallopeptidase n=1 Tax=Parablautia muri TaxID=2320879 RepID=A0A9X5BDN3_9FIRM|nr:M56 family metallopeptidase [Parablautia muri]NBJ91814.1 M56 family metallopeptidase [Parablautia muri]
MLSFINLLKMSFSGAVIILVIILIRALCMNRLPKRIFLALWMIALFRLLIPLSVSSPFSIYSLAQRSEGGEDILNAMEEMPAGELGFSTYQKQESQGEKENILTEDVENKKTNLETVYTERYSVLEDIDDKGEYAGEKADFSILAAVYLSGVVIFAGFFIGSYAKSCKKFSLSIPVDQEKAQNWINLHCFKRRISMRQTEFTQTPLTYGIISPVILMPKTTNWKDEKQLAYILAHELIHIKRFDAVTKIIMVGALCIHWFNPMVWFMYNLLNRDLEISCDEEVIRQFGEKTKASYARTLISMEEKRSGLVPLWNSFSKNAIGKSAMEERITAIMKMKRPSVIAVFGGMVLVFVTAIAFATSAIAVSEKDYLKRLPFEDLSDDESDKLLALWFEGYASMTVTDFQEKAWELTDTRAYMDLIEDFSKSEYAIQMEEGKEADALNEYMDYFYHVFEPLTAERWQVRAFNGIIVTDLKPENHAQVSWEYIISLRILKPDELKVGEYRDARLFAEEDMRSFLQIRKEAELSDASYLAEAARETVNKIERERSSEKLEVSIEYVLFPLEESLEDAVNVQVNEQWDETLAPYLEFGLTYEYTPSKDNPGNGLRMFWEGAEVRGIVDEERGMWITEHTGDSMYSEDAVELYVVYEKEGRRPRICGKAYE